MKPSTSQCSEMFDSVIFGRVIQRFDMSVLRVISLSRRSGGLYARCIAVYLVKVISGARSKNATGYSTKPASGHLHSMPNDLLQKATCISGNVLRPFCITLLDLPCTCRQSSGFPLMYYQHNHGNTSPKTMIKCLYEHVSDEQANTWKGLDVLVGRCLHE